MRAILRGVCLCSNVTSFSPGRSRDPLAVVDKVAIWIARLTASTRTRCLGTAGVMSADVQKNGWGLHTDWDTGCRRLCHSMHFLQDRSLWLSFELPNR